MQPIRTVMKSAVALLLVSLVVIKVAHVDADDDFDNLIDRISGVPADATAQAQAAALKTYERLVHGLRTAPDGLVNTAVRNAQCASDVRKEIEGLTANTLAIRPGDLSPSVAALHTCVDALRAAALETVSIVDKASAVRGNTPRELVSPEGTGPASRAPLEAASAANRLATETEKLSASVMGWSTAMERVSRQASQFAAAISGGRYRDLAVDVIQLRQASDDLERSLNQIRMQTGITKAAADVVRGKLKAAGPNAPEHVNQAAALLSRTDAVVDQVSRRLGALGLGCNQCSNAIRLYTSTDAQLWAASRPAFLGMLPAHLRSAVEGLDQAVTRANSLSRAVKGSVDLSLSAAQTCVAAPAPGMGAAVSDRSQSLQRLLRARSDRVWELEMTGVTAEVDSLVSLASKQVAVAVQSVAEVAAPHKTEAESRLSELVSIVQQLVQLHQQLTLHASGPGMIPRPGYVFAGIQAPPGASFRAVPIDAEAAAGATSRDLQAELQPLLRQLSDRVARERTRRGVK